jgi:hypothetical protein
LNPSLAENIYVSSFSFKEVGDNWCHTLLNFMVGMLALLLVKYGEETYN